MADTSDTLIAKLTTLNDSLDDLEDRLEPLLAQTLPESLLCLEVIQQVKLNVALPYLVYDLVFIYLKTRGIDPKTHPVVAELDCVRQYFDKIKNAEDPGKRQTAVDKAAANRFIKHAISQVKHQRTPGEASGSSHTNGPTHIRFDSDGKAPVSRSQSPAAAVVPVKVTSKMLARAEYQKQLAAGSQQSDDNDEDVDALQTFDGERAEEDEEEKTNSSRKGKGRAVDEEVEDAISTGGKKRRRPVMDPFAGYGDEASSKPAAKSPKKKKTKILSDEGAMTEGSSASGNAKQKIKSQTKKDSATSKKAKK